MVSSQFVVSSVLTLALLVGFVAFVARWGQRRPGVRVGDGSTEGAGEERAKPGGITRWLTTVDHRDIGVMYGAFALFSFAWGGIAVILMRTELMTATSNFLTATTYNALLTSHGITMLFLFGTPILAAFANYLIPLLIGADDMAFPRINAIAFWLLPPAAVLIWSGFLLDPLVDGIKPAMTSWTMYPPLGVEQVSTGAGSSAGGPPNPGADLMLLGLHLSGVSATMGAINFVATVFTERGENVGWSNLDIFSWTVLTQSTMIIFAFPLLGSALIMLLLDRNFGTTFFTLDGGGPILYQHLFWFFGHPEVYILVLPPMGLISYILPRFSGRKLFGFRFVVYSTLALGVLSFGVWAHHMFATGIDPRIRSSFMAVSLAVAVPSAVKTFNWITTMWNGRLRLHAPMLFCVGFIANFIIGGVTGVFEAAIPVDLLLHDTYHVIAHFHYVIMGAIAFAVFAGIYYWFPLVTGRWYGRTLAKWHFWLSMVGTNLTFFPMILLGYGGMPRRYATYDLTVGPQAYFTDLHVLASAGAFLLLFGQVVFVWNLLVSWVEGTPVESGDPWNLKRDGLFTREWQWFEQRRSDGELPTPTREEESSGVVAGSDDD